jgi:hypothetical protein
MSMTEEGLTTTTTTRPLEPMKIFPEQTWIPHSWRSLVRLRWNSWQLCLGICFHLEKSQRKHRRMKQREEYRDVLIGETESSHVIWLTSQTSSQESVHMLSRWKMVPFTSTPSTTATMWSATPIKPKQALNRRNGNIEREFEEAWC